MTESKKKLVLVAFNGETMCFAHVLLNALDMHTNGMEVKVVIEGSATKQIAELADASKPFAPLYAQVKQTGLIDAVCQACAAKMGALEAAKKQGLPLRGDMSGHPSLRTYINDGYDIVTF
ncbi:DsrE family protein [candidate division KSB1 bacterium]|nr:DsrE family protein [candidate division KSB1 bacterium]